MGRTSGCTRRSSAGPVARPGPISEPSNGPSIVFAPNTTTSAPTGGTPGSRYRRSPRRDTGTVPPLEYPRHFIVKRVTNAGTIRFKTRLLYLSTALRQHRIGLAEVDDGIWSLYFTDVLLGRHDEREALAKGQLGVTHVPG